MKFNKWTMGLAAVGVVSLASAVPKSGGESFSELQKSLVFGGDRDSSGKDPNECDCPCHMSGTRALHFAACCQKAPCGLNIKHGALALHIAECPRCQQLKK